MLSLVLFFCVFASGDEELPSTFGEGEEKQEKDVKESNSSSMPVYKWSQDSEDITVKFKVPGGTSKEKISCEIKVDSLDVRVGEDVLLSGALFAKVNSEESTWTLDEDRYVDAKKLQVKLLCDM